jgi:hypothetical protein
MRTLPETIAYLRDMIANESVSIMLIESAELTALCDAAEAGRRPAHPDDPGFTE